MRAYIGWIKKRFQPQLCEEANNIISAYYTRQRSEDRVMGSSRPRTTIRLLESLVRLAQAHARLMCRESATVQDAVMAIVALESSMHTCNVSWGHLATKPSAVSRKYTLVKVTAKEQPAGSARLEDLPLCTRLPWVMNRGAMKKTMQALSTRRSKECIFAACTSQGYLILP